MKELLVVSVCKEKLHELEFVDPVTDILQGADINFFVRHYSKIKKEDLIHSNKIIICGTSLQDNNFVEDIKSFGWLKSFKKPVLGICAGMQILGLIFGGKIDDKGEVGFYFENFKKEFLGLNGKKEVYHLHNRYVSGWGRDWEVFAEGNEIVQAVKHREKDLYGVLFHPEVRNKKTILEFVKE